MSGECCLYQPVRTHEDVNEGDIVFCQIGEKYWGHKVKQKTYVGGDYVYTISNLKGHEKWDNRSGAHIRKGNKSLAVKGWISRKEAVSAD